MIRLKLLCWGDKVITIQRGNTHTVIIFMRGGGIGWNDLAAVVLTGSPRSGLVVWGSGGSRSTASLAQPRI